MIEQKVDPYAEMTVEMMPHDSPRNVKDNARSAPPRTTARVSEPQVVEAVAEKVENVPTPSFPAPFGFEVSAQIGGVNVLAWNYEGMNSLPEGLEYEVAVAVGTGRSKGAAPLPGEMKNNPEAWHYTIKTGKNPLHHKATDISGMPIGDAKGVVMWYRVRVIQGELKGAWTPLIVVECNKWRTSSREPSRIFGLLNLFSL